jgi:hypothetical protein
MNPRLLSRARFNQKVGEEAFLTKIASNQNMFEWVNDKIIEEKKK